MEVKHKLLWDSIHPCAFMCYMIQQGHLPADAKVMETLDCYGFKTPGGFPDFGAMNREFERMRPDANQNT